MRIGLARLRRPAGAVLLLLAAQSAAAYAAVDCPAAVHGRRLIAFSLFEGDPAQMADLAPDSSRGGPGGRYVNVWQLERDAKLVAVCRYDGGLDQRIVLPAGLKRCRSEGVPRQLRAGCE